MCVNFCAASRCSGLGNSTQSLLHGWSRGYTLGTKLYRTEWTSRPRTTTCRTRRTYSGTFLAPVLVYSASSMEQTRLQYHLRHFCTPVMQAERCTRRYVFHYFNCIKSFRKL